MQCPSAASDGPLMLGQAIPSRVRCGGRAVILISLCMGLIVAVTLFSSVSVQEPTDAMIATPGLRATGRSVTMPFWGAATSSMRRPAASFHDTVSDRSDAEYVVGAATDVADRFFAAMMKYEVRGKEGTDTYRKFFLNKEGKEISPWHDLPLQTDAPNEFWMVTEIPKMTKPKMEIATKEASNPIAQDEKKGKLRDYHGPIFWNYGYLPQTWEDPTAEHPELKSLGDNDPVDVVEIGSKAIGQGDITRVKVLGALAMIDDGELDWKVIAVDAKDELAGKLNDIGDVEKELPGVVSGIREWFRWYKTPDGKPLNAFGYDGVALDKAKTLKIIEETHESYMKLKDGKVESKLWLK